MKGDYDKTVVSNFKTKIFIIPDDIPRALAIGAIRKNPATLNEIIKRLEFLDKCLEKGFCPGLKGKPHNKNGRVSYECIPLPEDLKDHAIDLARAVKRCSLVVNKRKVRLARKILEDIESLVADIAWKADPDRRRGKVFRPKGRRPSRLSKAIDAALIKLGLTASAREVLDFIYKASDGPIEFIDTDDSIDWCDRSGERTTPWKRFNTLVSERRGKLRVSR